MPPLTKEQMEAQAAAAGLAPQPLNAPAQPSIPIQAGGTPAMYNPATGAITAPDITTTTKSGASSGSSYMPETQEIKDVQGEQADTLEAKKAAVSRMSAYDVAENELRAEGLERQNRNLQEQLAEQQMARQAENAKVMAAYADVQAREKEQREFKPQTFGESMGTIRSALAAIGMGLGAWGASRGGGPNTAFQIFQAGEQAHQEKQRALIEQKAKAVEQATGNFKVAQDMRQRELEALDMKYLAKNKFLQNMIDAKVARTKSQKVAAEGELAKAQLDEAANTVKMNLAEKKAGTKTWDSPKESTTTVSGRPAPSTGGPTPMNVIDSYTAAKNAERDLSAGAASLSDEKSFSEWQQAYRDELRTEIQSRGGMKGITNLGQVIGAVEMNLADRLKTPGARAVNRAMVPVVARQARKLDSVGAMSDMTIDKAESSLGLASTTAQEMATVARGLAADEATKARAIEQQYPTLAGPRTAPQPAQPPAAPPRVPPEGQTSAQKKYTAETTKQIAQDKRDFRAERKTLAEATKLLKEKDLTPQQRGALEWAKKNPGDPRARQAIDKIGGK